MNRMTDQEKAAMDAGVKFGMELLEQFPKSDRQALEANMTGVLIVFWGVLIVFWGVLIVFWGALWGTFGTEYARGFIESQLRGIYPDVPHERFTEPRVQ